MEEPNIKKAKISEEAFPSFENLFDTLPTQVGVKRKKFIEIPPTTSIESTGPITFQINVGQNEQIFPAGVKVLMAIALRDSKTRKKLSAYNPQHDSGYPEQAFIPVGEMAHAVFSDIKVFLNGTKIDGGDALYPYRGAFNNKLFTSLAQKENSLEINGFSWGEKEAFEHKYKNATEYMESIHATANPKETRVPVHPFDSTAKAYAMRYYHSQKQDFLYYVDDIYSDIFQQTKPLPPGSSLTVQFTRSRPQFCLLNKTDTGSPYVHFEYCKLLVPIIELEPETANQINYEAFKEEKPMQFPLRSCQLQAIPKGGGMTDLSIDNILTGRITPRRIFVALVNTESMNGHFHLDPFNFGFYNVKEISCILNGQSSALPSLKCPHANEYYLPVLYLQETLGNQESGIDMKNFKQRNAIFAFDITGLSGVELENCFIRELVQPTGLRILTGNNGHTNLTVLIMKEYDSEIHIHGDGKVIIHPNA